MRYILLFLLKISMMMYLPGWVLLYWENLKN